MSADGVSKDRNQTSAARNNRGVGKGHAGSLRGPNSFRNVSLKQVRVLIAPSVRKRLQIGGVAKSEQALASACMYYCSNNVSLRTTARGTAQLVAMKAERVAIVPTALSGTSSRRNFPRNNQDNRPVDFAGHIYIDTALWARCFLSGNRSIYSAENTRC